MLQGYIERRERYFCERDKERVSLPFEWGLEHLGLPSDREPGAALRQFAAACLQDSASFYRCSPAPGYRLADGLLTFPSAVETAYPENNVVWGRLFPAGRRLAMIVLPQFNADWESHVGLCRLLARVGITALRLSPPYHHHRKPPHLLRPEYLASANLGRTIAATRQGVLDVRRATDWLLAEGYEQVGLVGSSVGALISWLALTHDPRLCIGTFIHITSYFADVVWNGMTTAHVRQALPPELSLEELRAIWAPISPMPYVDRLARAPRPVLMLSGYYDPTCLPELSRHFYRELEGRGVAYQSTWLPCGHYTMASWPFNLLVALRLLLFLHGLGWLGKKRAPC